MNIVNGMRPKIVSELPLGYKILMEQCWNADPSERPDSLALFNKFCEMVKPYISSESFQSETNNNLKKLKTNSLKIYTSNRSSKVYQFEDFPTPKNVTEGKIIFYLFIYY